MRLLNAYQKRISILNRIRGLFINTFLLGGYAKKLSISRNVEIWGKVKIGKNVFLGSNVKIYKDNCIANSVYIGDNVELRCNAGNKISIGERTTINRGSLIMGQVTIKDNCLIAPLCVVVGSNHNFESTTDLINMQGLTSKGIVINKNVWLGAHVTVLDGVTIGENSIIGAGSMVTKDIPENSIAVGNPCKVIKMRQ